MPLTLDCDFFVVKYKRKVENYFYEILLLNEILIKYDSKNHNLLYEN